MRSTAALAGLVASAAAHYLYDPRVLTKRQDEVETIVTTLCGAENSDAVCDEGYCCSQYGYCGTETGEDGHCGTGCQEDYSGTTCDDASVTESTESRCGADYDDAVCEDGYCCSQYGYCGTDTGEDGHCGTGCQEDYSGTTCDDASVTESTDIRCGADYDDAVCEDGYCCSEYGYCGTDTEYCAAPGCQEDYSGTSCDAAITPPTESTVDIPRPELGSVPYGSIITDCTEIGMMALTFDDGPYIYTADLLDILAATGAKATFFVNANNGGKNPIYEDEAYPSVVQKMHTDGHQIASHSWSHADLDSATDQELEDEIIKNEMALKIILGFIPTYFRPPYGNCGDACLAEMYKYGYHVIKWNLDTRDWEVGAEAGAANYDEGLSTASPLTDSFICLAHDIHETTVTELALHMILGAQEAGYELVTVGECLGDDKANWYRNTDDGGSWDIDGTSTGSTGSKTNTTGSGTGKHHNSGNSTCDSEEECGNPPAPTPSCDGEGEGGMPPPSGTCDSEEECGMPPPSGTCDSEEECGMPPSSGTCDSEGECGTCDSEGKCGMPPPSGTCDSEEECGMPPPSGTCDSEEECGMPPPSGTGMVHPPHITPACGGEGGCGNSTNNMHPPTVVTTTCSNFRTTVTLTYTSTYCPRPTAPPGAGHFGAPDSPGVYSHGYKSPNCTATDLVGVHPTEGPAPTGGMGGGMGGKTNGTSCGGEGGEPCGGEGGGEGGESCGGEGGEPCGGEGGETHGTSCGGEDDESCGGEGGETYGGTSGGGEGGKGNKTETVTAGAVKVVGSIFLGLAAVVFAL